MAGTTESEKPKGPEYLDRVYDWEDGKVVGERTYYRRNGLIPGGRNQWGIQGEETVVEKIINPPLPFPGAVIIEVGDTNGKDDSVNHIE